MSVLPINMLLIKGQQKSMILKIILFSQESSYSSLKNFSYQKLPSNSISGQCTYLKMELFLNETRKYER